MWQAIYEALGDALFEHILKEYFIFMISKNETLVQISGLDIHSYILECLG